MGTLGCRRDPGQGQREGLVVLGGHPNCPLGPADRARDSAGCWGDGAESCETARGKGESMSPGQRAAVPTLHKKSHTAPSKPSSFSPPGGGICERCPACHTLHRVRCLCLHSLQGHQAERRCGTAPGLQGKVPALLLQPLPGGVRVPGKGHSSGAASCCHRAWAGGTVAWKS